MYLTHLILLMCFKVCCNIGNVLHNWRQFICSENIGKSFSLGTEVMPVFVPFNLLFFYATQSKSMCASSRHRKTETILKSSSSQWWWFCFKVSKSHWCILFALKLAWNESWETNSFDSLNDSFLFSFFLACFCLVHSQEAVFCLIRICHAKGWNICFSWSWVKSLIASCKNTSGKQKRGAAKQCKFLPWACWGMETTVRKLIWWLNCNVIAASFVSISMLIHRIWFCVVWCDVIEGVVRVQRLNSRRSPCLCLCLFASTEGFNRQSLPTEILVMLQASSYTKNDSKQKIFGGVHKIEPIFPR